MTYDWDGRQTKRLKLIQGVGIGMIVIAVSAALSLIFAWAVGTA